MSYIVILMSFQSIYSINYAKRKRYYGSRVLYYSNSHASFQLLRLTTGGPVQCVVSYRDQ